MLYSEFLEGTKARDNEHNYRVYKSIEAIYMDSDTMTKQDVYKAAAHLIDNTPSAETLELIEMAKAEIETAQAEISHYMERIETMKAFIEIETDAAQRGLWKDSIKEYRKQIQRKKEWIARHKFFLAGIQ